jgi:hypothetical protein
MTLALHGKSGGRRRWLAFGLLLALMLSIGGGTLLGGGAARASGTVVVKPSAMNGWVAISDTVPPDGDIPTFVSGPVGAPLGTGSARFVTTLTSNRPMLATGAYIGTPLASITNLEYQTFRTAPSGGVLAAALQFDIDFSSSDLNTGWQGRLVYEPYLEPATVNAGVWQTWHPLAGRWWFSSFAWAATCGMSNPCTWATVLTTYPTASIRGATLFKAGSGWASFDGNVDAFTIGVSGTDTTYDFEPETPCTTVCYADAVNGNDAFGGDLPTSAKKTIQAAMNQVSVGGTVHVAAGTYPENLDVNKPLSIVGSGSGTNPLVDTIVDPISGSFGIFIHEPVNLQDLRVTGAPSHGIRVEKATVTRLAFAAVTWDNIASSANGGEGVEIHNGTDVSGMAILNSEFSENAAQGIRSASDVTIDGMNITDSEFDNNSYGLYLQGTIDDLVISGSSVNSNSVWGLYMSETGPITNVLIEKNSFIGNAGWGIVMYTGSALGISDVTITRNWIDNPGSGGVGAFVEAGASVTDVNGTCNWWGDASGPSGEGPGIGDEVDVDIAFNPWLLTWNLDGPCAADNLGPISSNIAPSVVAVGVPFSVTALVSDVTTGNNNVVSASFTIDGGLPVVMVAADLSFDSPSESVTGAAPSFATPGVYEICVTGVDIYGNVGSPACQLIAVYDPSAGFVTGGGTIYSAAGAYRLGTSLEGKANFGFVSKYVKGKTVPTGNTEFQFKAAGLNFSSTSYEWLVVSGNKAQYRGLGTLNGETGYTFKLTAWDVSGGDKIRMQIWDSGNGLVYDNGSGGDDIDVSNPQLISTGQIVIHK